ncbi:MAG: hypothetical protein DBX92_02190 [Dielma fastidiosa]|nr:MAG: hypothetical protein DBX92_02190 [Dielma fastidiosa]
MMKMEEHTLKRDKYLIYLLISCLLMLFSHVFSMQYILNIIFVLLNYCGLFKNGFMVFVDLVTAIDYLLVFIGGILFFYSIFRLIQLYYRLESKINRVRKENCFAI